MWKINKVEVSEMAVNHKNKTATGKAIVYNTNTKDPIIEFVDEFEFYYEIESDFIQCYVDDATLEDSIEIIDIKLKDAIKAELC